MFKGLHKGLVVQQCNEAGYVYVWIPTANSSVPSGFSEYLYQNTGGNLYGNDLSHAIQTSYKCKIASPVTGGAWFRESITEASSIFDDYSDTPYFYPLMWNYQTHGNTGNRASYVMSSDNPAITGSVAVNTLSVAGGNSTHQKGTLPKGQFPIIETNQWVIVAFLEESINPVIIASLHSDEAWDVVVRK